MERVILHSDANGFYASVECLRHPELRDKPMVVGGDVQARHGIVLAKNPLAKQWGIRTGQVLWQARQSCPGLVIQPPDYPQYLRFSRLLQNIYLTYADRVEPFGLDECWLDVTGCNGEALAQEIRQRVKAELGITVSIGVSFNKIFAKLGSDYKKPDAVTIITRENFQEYWSGLCRQVTCFMSGRPRGASSKGCVLQPSANWPARHRMPCAPAWEKWERFFIALPMATTARPSRVIPISRPSSRWAIRPPRCAI